MFCIFDTKHLSIRELNVPFIVLQENAIFSYKVEVLFMVEQNITMKQKNSSGSYDTLYPATTVNQLSGVLPESKGGTGVTSLSAMLTAAGGARSQTGSYTGTGTYGEANAMSITFDFEPYFFAVEMVGDGSEGGCFANSGTHSNLAILPAITNRYNKSQAVASAFGTGKRGKWDKSTLTYSWYNTSAEGQFNRSEKTYQWIAIG